MARLVTLHIDENSLRLLVTRGRQIEKWADTPLEPGSIKGGVVTDEEKVAAKIKELLATQGVNDRAVTVSISGLHSLTRLITMPKLPRAILEEAITREAKRVLPVPIEQLYLAWQVVPSVEGKTQVFVVATPRRAVDSVLKVLGMADLKTMWMDIKPLAIARVVREVTAIIVDVQSGEFDIIIITDRVPQHIRTVPSPDEALSVGDKLSIVRDELERTIKFYDTNNPEKHLGPTVPLYVSGELERRALRRHPRCCVMPSQ